MMKNLFLLSVFLFCGIISAQDLEGAWKLTHEDGLEVVNRETIKIYQDGYFAFGTKETQTNMFIEAGGGKYNFNGKYNETFDFHTESPVLVGEKCTYDFELKVDTLTISESGKETVWKKISSKEDDLTGNWVITGRQRNGELSTMIPGDRRTIKILGGGRFQWVAFNSKTKEFSGTGGGTYSTQNGKYIENIEFFSRDDSRVGAILEFNYEVKNGQWHHSGKSSKGDPVYEIWSSYKEAYKK